MNTTSTSVHKEMRTCPGCLELMRSPADHRCVGTVSDSLEVADVLPDRADVSIRFPEASWSGQ
jgi:hypothetical protein